MKSRLILLFLLIVVTGVNAQPSGPSDFLSKDFHKERRDKLREEMPANSVAVLFANPVRNRSNDVDYVYHQNTDFFYLTGYREPNAVLLVFKEMQEGPDRKPYNEIFFVQPRNAQAEMWDGRRLGDGGVKNLLGFAHAFNNTQFAKYTIDFKKFTNVLFFDFENDVRDDKYDSADLFNLIEHFKVKTGYPTSTQLAVQRETSKNNLNTRDLGVIMNKLRQTKTAEEIDLIRKAVQISSVGQVEVMKAMKPGMSEREIQGLHEYVFKKYQAEDVGYPSIVGAGNNGCILHYIDNYKPEISSKELILMDLGAEYRGYTADITRTIPVSGKFTTAQRQIYELVLKAQEAARKICKEGTSFSQLTMATKETINNGLAELGIIKSPNEPHLYYPHGCCHHIGLDVHDRGTYRVLQESMVITIEPGIYIPENANCDPKWWGIAVRIEDDFLINKEGCELLSAYAPRTIDEIEKTMALPSPLDDFTLPPLPDDKR